MGRLEARWLGERLLATVLLLFIVRSLIMGAHYLGSLEVYETRRDAAAFLGLDTRAVRGLVDGRLAPDTPLGLGRSLFAEAGFGEDFWYRATYAFYPRRIVKAASHTLEISPREFMVEGLLLGHLDEHRSLVLIGPPDPSPGSTGAVLTRFDPWGIALALAGVFGLGTLARLLLRLGPGRLIETVLAGVLTLALAAHLATWLQVACPFRWLSGLGLVFAIPGGVRAALSFVRRPKAGPGEIGWRLLPLSVAGLSLAGAVLDPVTGWDGRFIWLFHGAQLFSKGFLDVAESATLGPLQPIYPLLTPALFSFGSAWGADFNERTAAILVVILHAAVVGATARMAMARMGSWRGALFVSLSAIVTMGWSKEAYADGLLASTLALQFLALGSKDEQRLGWLATACAALTKREGLLLALVVALVQRGFRAWRPIVLTLSPALFHAAWCRSMGLVHEMDAPRLPLDLVDLVSRTAMILRKSAGVVKRDVSFWWGASAFVALVLLRLRGRLSEKGGPAFLAAASLLAFTFVTFLVTPQPLSWHLGTALSRLALHPSVLALLGAFDAWSGAERRPAS